MLVLRRFLEKYRVGGIIIFCVSYKTPYYWWKTERTIENLVGNVAGLTARPFRKVGACAVT